MKGEASWFAIEKSEMKSFGLFLQSDNHVKHIYKHRRGSVGCVPSGIDALSRLICYYLLLSK